MAEQLNVIKSDTLTAVISNVGATLKKVTDKTGNEYIWQGDPASWQGSCPILFPVCGGLNKNRFILDGKSYNLPRHGFIRFCEFEVVSHTQNEIVYRFMSDKESFSKYPFVHEFFVTFSLRRNELSVTYGVKNNDRRTMFFSIGAHEGYALDYPIEDYRLVFDKKDLPPVYSDTFEDINPSSVSYGDDGALSLRFGWDQFEQGSVMMHPFNSTKVSLVCDRSEKKLSVDLSEAEYLVFWTLPGARFLCIEPWNGISDPAEFSGEISEKEGIISLKANECYRYTHKISFE